MMESIDTEYNGYKFRSRLEGRKYLHIRKLQKIRKEAESMNIQIAGISKNSIVDGEGMRYTLFVQGCDKRCKGCQNPQTHSRNGGAWIDTDEVIQDLQNDELLDGITFSGGEPFLQGEALSLIGKAAHILGMNVWCFTGYTFEDILRKSEHISGFSELLEQVDVLVDGEFIEEEKSLELKFKGSKNQRIIDVKQSLLRREIVEIF